MQRQSYNVKMILQCKCDLTMQFDFKVQIWFYNAYNAFRYWATSSHDQQGKGQLIPLKQVNPSINHFLDKILNI